MFANRWPSRLKRGLVGPCMSYFFFSVELPDWDEFVVCCSAKLPFSVLACNNKADLAEPGNTVLMSF